MLSKEFLLLALIFFINKSSFGQSVSTKINASPKSDKIVLQLDSSNQKLLEIGHSMETKLKNQEYSNDKEITTKDFTIERSPNIKIIQTTEKANP